MRLCLVHHADAVGPDVDPQRPLSATGMAQADRLADAVAASGFSPAAIWHSGKLRARQTADPFLRRFPFAAMTMVRGLLPDDPPAIARDAVLRDSRDLLLVGHMPNIAAVLRLLAPGSPEFPLHGAVLLETADDGVTWRGIPSSQF